MSTVSSHAATVLFPTRFTPPSSDASELARINYIEALGYTVLQIDSKGTTAEYSAALAQSDVVYISERVNTSNVSAELKDGCTGVVSEELNLLDEFGIVSGNTGQWYYEGTEIALKDLPSHYILQDFPAAIGNYQIFGPALSQDLQYINGSLPASYDLLAFNPSNLSQPTLVAIETGDLLADGTFAAGRRVFLPWMQSSSSASDFNAITTYGQYILDRSLEWALQDNDCAFLQKRAYTPSGDLIPDSSSLPSGSEIKFLLYINNKGSALSDITIQDILDTAAFTYSADSIQIDNTVGACTNNTCTTTEERAIFFAVNDNSTLLDSVDNDGASYNAGSIDIGESTAPVINSGNGAVPVNDDSVLAVLFTVTIN